MRYVGDHVAVVIAETLAQAKDAAELVDVDYDVLPAAVDVATAQNAGQPQIHAEAPNNTVYQWHLGDKAAVDAAFAKRQARHQDRPRQQPADPQRHRAARRHRRLRLRPGQPSRSTPPARTRTWRAWCCRAFIGIAPEHKLRVIAPDVGGGFGSKIFIYAEETVVPLGRQEGRPAGEVDGGPHARPSSPTRTAAITSRTPSWRSTATARSWRCGPRPRPTSAPICRPSPRRCRPISTRRCCRASTTSRRSTARSTASTPTPRRSTPIAAPAGRRRPSWSSGWSRWRRAQTRHRPGRVPPPELHHDVPAPDAGHHDLRRRRLRRLHSTRRWSWPTTRASPRARRKAPRRASCAASASRPTSRPAASRRARRSARSAPASACGSRRRCASTRPAPSRCSPARTATARATRPPSPSSSRSGSA